MIAQTNNLLPLMPVAMAGTRNGGVVTGGTSSFLPLLIQQVQPLQSAGDAQGETGPLGVPGLPLLFEQQDAGMAAQFALVSEELLALLEQMDTETANPELEQAQLGMLQDLQALIMAMLFASQTHSAHAQVNTEGEASTLQLTAGNQTEVLDLTAYKAEIAASLQLLNASASVEAKALQHAFLPMLGQQASQLRQFIAASKASHSLHVLTEAASALSETLAKRDKATDATVLFKMEAAASAHLQRLTYKGHFMNAAASDTTSLESSVQLQGELMVAGEGLQAGQLTEAPKATVHVQQQAQPSPAPPVPIQQFASAIEGMLVKSLRLASGNGVTEAKITLMPEHLGQVDVRITIRNGQVTAQFMAEHGMAKELIEGQLVQLRQALQGQGLVVERLEVTQSASSQQMFQDGRQFNSHQGGQHAGRNQTRDNQAAEEAFDEELKQQAIQEALGYGAAVNARA